MTETISRRMGFEARFVSEDLPLHRDTLKMPLRMLPPLIRMAGTTPVISHTATRIRRSGTSWTARKS